MTKTFDGRKALMFCRCLFSVIFLVSRLQSPRWSREVSVVWCYVELVKLADTFRPPLPSPKFNRWGVNKCEITLNLVFDSSRLWHIAASQMRKFLWMVLQRKCKTSTKVPMTDRSDSDITLPTLPNIYRAVKKGESWPNVDIWGALVSKRSHVSEIWNQCWKRK